MRSGRALVIVCLAMLVAGVGSRGAAANGSPAPFCFDPVANGYLEATAWLDAPGTLVGTPGRDVLVGSPGTDVIRGLDGNDLICGQPLDPNEDPATIFPALVGWAFDTIDAGSGNDAVIARGNVTGGSGNDSLVVSGGPIRAGSGNDRIDFIEAGAVDVVLDGGSGADKITSFGARTLLGSSGNDLIVNRGLAEKIDCGSGIDTADNTGASPAVRRCERVVSAP